MPMAGSPPLLYHVAFSRDAETDRVVVEVPALQLADFGADVPEALDRLQAMVSFHLDCLVQEGKPIPVERGEDAGFYLRVKLPPHAA
jgi:predicted RNase H-like HicB family nuclease